MAARRRVIASIAAAASLAVLTAGCSGAGGGGGGGGDASDGGSTSINVVMVNNPQMVDLQKLTADNFTKDTGITVNYKVLPENDARDTIQTDFSQQSGQYDVATISNYEVPFFSANKWIANLDENIAADSAFKQDDILTPIADGLKGADG